MQMMKPHLWIWSQFPLLCKFCKITSKQLTLFMYIGHNYANFILKKAKQCQFTHQNFKNYWTTQISNSLPSKRSLLKCALPMTPNFSQIIAIAKGHEGNLTGAPKPFNNYANANTQKPKSPKKQKTQKTSAAKPKPKKKMDLILDASVAGLLTIFHEIVNSFRTNARNVISPAIQKLNV